jgi:redox-sensitive bicupin YhaK (pirin superfamily)
VNSSGPAARLMTAGRAIAHSEESAAGRPAVLHGLQLWIALPEQDRFIEPRCSLTPGPDEPWRTTGTTARSARISSRAPSDS